MAVRLAVQGDGNRGEVDRVFLAVADADEGGACGSDLPVEAQVAFIGVVVEGNEDVVVVLRQARACEAGGGQAGDALEIADDLGGERIDRACGEGRVGGIDCSRDRVADGYDEVSVELVLRGQREDRQSACRTWRKPS